MIKKAMIMAAGVGSRLGLMSEIVPKPLVPVFNVPVIDILLKNLSLFNIKDVIANTYYKAEYIQNHCIDNEFGVNFNYIKEEELSGTAGGLAKCKFFLENEEDFIVLSADGLADLDFNAVYQAHKSSGAIATIITKEIKNEEVSKYGIIVPNKNGTVKTFQEKPSINEALSNLANTGIYLFKAEIFKYIPQNTFFDFAKNLFPLLMKNNIKINTYKHNGYWSDIGSIEQYKQSNIDCFEHDIIPFNIEVIKTENGKYIKGEKTNISEFAKIEGSNIIGNNCQIGKNVLIKNSILWDNVRIEDNVEVENSIILTNANVKRNVKNDIVNQQHNAVLV